MSVSEIQNSRNNITHSMVEPLRPSKPAVRAAGPKPTRDIVRFRTHGKTPKRDSMLSCRYELKYRISESKARAIAEYIRPNIPLDRYARSAVNEEYPVSSLYFDSNQLHLAKETIDKKTNRFKLRVRCYDDNFDSPCFIEIKRRANSVILKDRAQLSKGDLDRAVTHMHIPESLNPKDEKILKQFQFYLFALRACPIVLVRYNRQAFEGDFDNRVRVTFDRQLSFKSVDRPEVTTNGPGWRVVPMDFVVLEVKFTDRYPIWLSDMIKIFDLKQTAMSKYVSSVKTSCSLGFCGPAHRMGV